MKKVSKQILSSPWLRSVLLLLVVHFSQVYPFYHWYHGHDEGSLRSTAGTHPVDFDLDHSTDHHHHDDVPHTDNHQHTYDKHFDWHVVRIENPRPLAFNSQFLPALDISIPTYDRQTASLEFEALHYFDNEDVLSVDVRGPPLLA